MSKSESAIRLIDPENLLWLEADEITAMMDAWRNLVELYRWTDETDISVLALREYLQWRRVLADVLNGKFFDVVFETDALEQAKQKAQQYLSQLDYFVDEIVKEVERTVNNS